MGEAIDGAPLVGVMVDEADVLLVLQICESDIEDRLAFAASIVTNLR
jgi:hypothetical protein